MPRLPRRRPRHRGRNPQVLLDHIAELSRNARATWFALIGLCLFVGVTLLGHKDADFFAYGAETRLPLVNVDIPVRSFFIFAPVLVAALYIYLHLYLMRLWDALADAPSEIGGQPLADRVYPWLISHAALWYRGQARDDRATAPHALDWVVVAVSVALGWLFGAVVLFFLWYRSLPAHEEWLSLWIAACLWAAAVVGHIGYHAARVRIGSKSGTEVARLRTRSRWLACAIAALLVFLSWETTEGSRILTFTKTGEQVFQLYPANLREAELTRKPSGTVPFDVWIKDFEQMYRTREGIKDGTDLSGNRDFIVEATTRYNAPLDPPDLSGRDLRNADMTGAFLPGADFRRAKLQGAVLTDAEMQGAVLRQSDMRDAVLSNAEMQGADLRKAEMQGAYLSEAAMQGADLSRAEMQGSTLSGAKMQGAYLSGAEMQGVILWNANLQEAELWGARLEEANLRGAEMQGADLRGSDMKGAYLWGADMKAANLRGVAMQGADIRFAAMPSGDCQGAFFQGALLHSAMLRCENLTQLQLEQAVGDPQTLLPEGLTVASCLELLPGDVDALLSRKPEHGGVRLSRAEFRDLLLCDRDASGKLMEQPSRVGLATPAEAGQ